MCVCVCAHVCVCSCMYVQLIQEFPLTVTVKQKCVFFPLWGAFSVLPSPTIFSPHPAPLPGLMRLFNSNSNSSSFQAPHYFPQTDELVAQAFWWKAAMTSITACWHFIDQHVWIEYVFNNKTLFTELGFFKTPLPRQIAPLDCRTVLSAFFVKLWWHRFSLLTETLNATL